MKKNALPAIALAVAALIPATAGYAQVGGAADAKYPSRAIRTIVAYPPGGAVDLMARAVGQKLTDLYGQPVLVENRPGAHGGIGAQAVAKAPPDGYTLLILDRGALTINPSLYKSLPYSPADFSYIGVSTELSYVLAVSSALPVKTFQEFVQLAKSKPGVINYASFGIGSIIQLNFEQMNSHFGIKLTHVPYKGTAEASVAVLNGDIGIIMSSYAGLAGFIKDGRLRPLAVTRSSRSATLPDVPTMAEVGGGSDTVVPTYFTYAAPAGTPQAIIARLNTDMGRIILAPEMVERLTKAGMEPHVTPPEEFSESIKRDVARFGKLVNSLGIPPQ